MEVNIFRFPTTPLKSVLFLLLPNHWSWKKNLRGVAAMWETTGCPCSPHPAVCLPFFTLPLSPPPPHITDCFSSWPVEQTHAPFKWWKKYSGSLLYRMYLYNNRKILHSKFNGLWVKVELKEKFACCDKPINCSFVIRSRNRWLAAVSSGIFSS